VITHSKLNWQVVTLLGSHKEPTVMLMNITYSVENVLLEFYDKYAMRFCESQ